MSNLTTLRALIKSELHMNSPYVDAAIADAMRFVSHEQLWFNGASFNFKTVADVYVYPLPADYLGMRGAVYCTPNGLEGTSRYPLVYRSVDEIETYMYSLNEWDGAISTGRAKQYSIDLKDKKILISPIPSDGDDSIFFRYTRDLGVPTYTMSVTSSAPPSLTPAVTLLGPNGETLAADYHSEWFDQKKGFVLVQSRALYELWSRFHSGTENSAMLAQQALSRYLEELLRIRGETAEIQSVIKVRKRL